jgi:hypothetical protein
MAHFSFYVPLQCLAALLAWALIATFGTTTAAMLEAGLVWLAPLALAAGAGLSPDGLTLLASCGIVFNLVNWVFQGREE